MAIAFFKGLLKINVQCARQMHQKVQPTMLSLEKAENFEGKTVNEAVLA